MKDKKTKKKATSFINSLQTDEPSEQIEHNVDRIDSNNITNNFSPPFNSNESNHNNDTNRYEHFHDEHNDDASSSDSNNSAIQRVKTHENQRLFDILEHLE